MRVSERLKETVYAIGFFISKDVRFLDWKQLAKKHMKFAEIYNILVQEGYNPPSNYINHEDFERFQNMEYAPGARDAALERWHQIGELHGTQERVIWLCAELMMIPVFFPVTTYDYQASFKADCDVILETIADKKSDASASEDLIETVYVISFLFMFVEDKVSPLFEEGEIYDHPNFDELLGMFKPILPFYLTSRLFENQKAFKWKDRWDKFRYFSCSTERGRNAHHLDSAEAKVRRLGMYEKFGTVTDETNREKLIVEWIKSMDDTDNEKLSEWAGEFYREHGDDEEFCNYVIMLHKAYADEIVDLLKLRINAPNARTGRVGPTACVYCGKHIRKK